MSFHVNPGPNATYSSSSTQTIANVTLGQVVTYDTIETQSGISLSVVGGVGSKIYLGQSGDYMINISAICNAASGSNKNISMWFRKNGTDIPRSNTALRITSGNPQVLCVSFIYSFAAGDYLELVMSGDTTNCQILATPAVVAPSTPVQPATPSIVISLVQVA